jgi:uncharacterized repeat protein (TIGR03803 family)
MKRLNLSLIMLAVCAIAAIAVALPVLARAQSLETVIHHFPSESGDGSAPLATLSADNTGNFYGTTDFGGAYGEGSVFELTPTATGWSESVIYSFAGGATGSSPGYTGVAVDKNGNLYGTTYSGGTVNSACSIGCGLVYELSPTSSGWQETVLYNFTGPDGQYPNEGTLVFDASGNLYGVTGNGGTSGTGVVFKLAPSAGTWTESVIYDFPDHVGLAVNPWSVSMDASGNLYGVAVGGGMYGFGTIFKLTPNSSGGWTESNIYSFTGGADSGYPRTNLIFDSAGNIYGMSSGNPGGAGFGAVFKLSPAFGGGLKFSVLYTFTGVTGGFNPGYQLAMDAAGNLYGTTFYGGNASYCVGNAGCGVVFKLTPKGSAWKESVLRIFTGRTGGNFPNGVIFNAAGTALLGTTAEGGAGKDGVVFEVVP